MHSPIRLVIAYPKELIRAGLREMLAGAPVTIAGEAADVPRVLKLAKEHKPEVVLLDVALPGGDAFELVTAIKDSLPQTNVVLIAALDNPTYLARARAVGAVNCLLKSVSRKELLKAVEDAAAGKAVPGTGPFAKIAAALEPLDAQAVREKRLTPRESQVLSHVAFGLSNDEIARSLTISVETVKEHVRNVLQKLSVSDRTQAAVWAVRMGLV